MSGYKRYELNDPKDIRSLNKLFEHAGIQIEMGLFEPYIIVDTDRFRVFAKRKAGRRTVVTASMRQNIFTLKFEGKSVREIADTTGVSTGTVSMVLKNYDEPEETDQMTIDMM